MLTFFRFVLWVLIAIPFALLALVLAGAVLADFLNRQTIKVAEKIPCPKCGQSVGRVAILAAQEQFKRKVQEMHQQRPDTRFRIGAEWEIVCPNCGFKLYFDPVSRKIETQSRFAK